MRAPPTVALPRHAQRLLVAGHAARARHGVVGVELGQRRRSPRARGRRRRRRRRTAGATRAAARPSSTSSPAALTSSHDDGADDLDAALGARPPPARRREKRMARPLAPPVGQPEPGDAVELGAGVAEGDRHRVAEAVAVRRARRVVLGADAHGSARGSTSVAVLSTSAPGAARPGAGRALPGDGHDQPPGEAPHEQPADDGARRRQQEGRAEDVGDEAGREQQRAAEDDERAVDHLARRDAPRRDAPR